MTTPETALAQRQTSGPPRPAPVSQPQLWALPYEPASVGTARRLVRDHLTRWGLADLVDTAVLVVSELVTNAVKTGCRRRLELEVELVAGVAVRVVVRDGCRTMPVLVDDGADSSAEGGRGLALVDHLSDHRWGVVPESAGKRVWAIVGAPAGQQSPAWREGAEACTPPTAVARPCSHAGADTELVAASADPSGRGSAGGLSSEAAQDGDDLAEDGRALAGDRLVGGVVRE
ncbi:ATP-binding protein [Kitasatospora sp. NPDC001540]|uniref:ATP-binding protein n=1 Tax=Kitasatospora sp. NPDC001540 TaxID=3364014 RepID=UPI00368BCE0B